MGTTRLRKRYADLHVPVRTDSSIALLRRRVLDAAFIRLPNQHMVRWFTVSDESVDVSLTVTGNEPVPAQHFTLYGTTYAKCFVTPAIISTGAIHRGWGEITYSWEKEGL